MTTGQMAGEMAERLNRPTEDDLFSFPGEYYRALSRAHRFYYRAIAGHRPDMLYQAATVTSADGGSTFVLTDDHYGELLLFRSPGPPNGAPLLPSLPEGRGHYWVKGRTIHLHSTYPGTIHLLWTPATVADLDDTQDSLLPVYCDEAVIERGCYYLAQKPGFLGNPEVYLGNAQREWGGEQGDPSDMGVLGIISRQSAFQPYEGISADPDGEAWWRGIPG